MLKFFFKLPRVRNRGGKNLAKDFKNSQAKSKLEKHNVAIGLLTKVTTA